MKMINYNVTNFTVECTSMLNIVQYHGWVQSNYMGALHPCPQRCSQTYIAAYLFEFASGPPIWNGVLFINCPSGNWRCSFLWAVWVCDEVITCHFAWHYTSHTCTHDNYVSLSCTHAKFWQTYNVSKWNLDLARNIRTRSTAPLLLCLVALCKH